MNSIAQRALDRAGETPAPALIASIQTTQPLPELVITGPIIRVMELKGRRFALEVVQALGPSLRNTSAVKQVIGNTNRRRTAIQLRQRNQANYIQVKDITKNNYAGHTSP